MKKVNTQLIIKSIIIITAMNQKDNGAININISAKDITMKGQQILEIFRNTMSCLNAIYVINSLKIHKHATRARKTIASTVFQMSLFKETHAPLAMNLILNTQTFPEILCNC